MSNSQTTSAGIGAGPRSALSAWAHHHRQAALISVDKLIREPIASFLTVLVIGVALAVPSLGLSLAATVQGQISQIDAPPQLSVLLGQDASLEDADKLRTEILRKPGIADVKVIDRDSALADFVSATGLENLVQKLNRNPLPHTLWVYPSVNTRLAGVEQLQVDLGSLAGVSQVILDSRWLERLNAFTDLLRTIALVLGAVMAVGVVLTLGNTLRLGIEARRDEIVVIKLIGGGNAFARRPFLYTGLFTGALGGVFGGLLSGAALLMLDAPVKRLFDLYDQAPSVPSLILSELLVLVSIGAILGLISAWYSVQLHLTRIQPR